MGSQLDNGTFLWVGCNEKNFVPMHTVIEEMPDVDHDQSVMYANLQRASEFSFTIQAKINKGIMDVMMGKDTPAARRYIRCIKRMKEKKRRNRLKSGNV